MKDIDKLNIGIIVVTSIIYFILCYKVKYKSYFKDDIDVKFTHNDYTLLYITTVFGFIYGTIIVSFQQRYLVKSVTDLWIWIFILYICILLIFLAFYAQVYMEGDTKSFIAKFSYSMMPILPSLVILCETSISEVLDHGFNN